MILHSLREHPQGKITNTSIPHYGNCSAVSVSICVCEGYNQHVFDSLDVWAEAEGPDAATCQVLSTVAKERDAFICSLPVKCGQFSS